MKNNKIKCLLFIFAGILMVFGAVDTSLAHLSKRFPDNKIISEIKKAFCYNDIMMDADSIKENILGTRISNKEVVKTYSDSLIDFSEKISDDSIKQTVLRISELKEISENANAKFLYCSVPKKNYYTVSPENHTDYTKQNYDIFIEQLNKEKIPYLDLKEIFRNQHSDAEELYYRTDHHWKTEVGFMAASAVSKELKDRYGLSYREYFTDIKNYKIKTYKNWFLGSYGKKVGAFFTWKGADDFDLITPKFKTDLSEIFSYSDEIKQGSFEEIIIDKENLEKNYYNISTYNTYAATKSHRVKIIKNDLTDAQNVKTLVVQTSFAQTVTPFLALQNKEVHICDVRIDQNINDPKINLAEYIEKIKPDYVLVFYDYVYPVNHEDDRYNFFNQ